MRVLVTGAGGFLGGAVVRACLERGHAVTGLYRPAKPPVPSDLPEGVDILLGDLRQPHVWQDRLSDVEAVIHCAAAVSGDLPEQLPGTVVATENLLQALPVGLQRFVHVSSFSVYDFDAPSFLGRLDEETPLEKRAERRDGYTQAKLIQERLVREQCAERDFPLVVVRPGAIYGPGKEWGYGSTMRLGRFDLIFAPFTRMRLAHVDNCADALVRALDAPIDGETIVNVVDDEQPSYWAYHRRAKAAGAPVGLGVPVPYWCVLGLGATAWTASRLFFKGQAKLPMLVDLPRQRVEWRPLRYANARVKDKLGWRPRRDLNDGLQTMVIDKG